MRVSFLVHKIENNRHSTSCDRWASCFDALYLRPNPHLGQTSHILKTLGKILIRESNAN